MNQQNGLLAGLAAALICLLFFGLLVLILYVFFCLTLQRTQTAVRPRNRLIPPGLVWLHLLHLAGFIPLLGIVFGIAASVWDLIMVLRLAGSLQNEFEYRGWRTSGEGFGRPVGLVWAIGQLATLPLGLVMNVLGPNTLPRSAAMVILIAILLFGLLLFVCWIVYWVQMAQYGRRLREDAEGYGYREGSVEEDYDDEYRGRRRRATLEDDDDYDRPRRPRHHDYGDEEDRPRRRDRDDD
ncbi:MAG: hypothetical protein J2P46_05090 [Zavarzinella sp.]|nr:hypothetical protein [Zavarzinella sp.]